ncbi:glutathione S-transferase [Parvibaculum sp.]|uniref:glutathione S-transferase family protein n=1 Tax=Parvibaculum sp. TaxID=2024848 RepID=UPI0032968C47
MSMDGERLELHQFPYSHYNEKVRWALDFKSVSHKRISHLPGPHMAAVRKLAGVSETPILRVGGVVVAGSADIIDVIEDHYPEPPLYPADAAQRKSALAAQTFFDEEIAPAVRRALFGELLKEPAYLCRMLASEKTLFTRLSYRAMQPAIRQVMRRMMEIDENSVAIARRAIRAGLDHVAAEAGPEGYLAGDRFTVADLAAAALLAPACNPPHPDMEFPQPRPARLDAWLNEWADHPGTAWVRSIYAKHRPQRVLPLRAPAD